MLLRESGAQSDIPPLYAVICSTRSERKPYRSIDAESSLYYIIIIIIICDRKRFYQQLLLPIK